MIEKRPRPPLRIEKGIPPPKPRENFSFWYPYFDALEVTDSFLVKTVFDARAASTASWHYRKRNRANRTKRFTVRRVAGGWRCWRMK